MRGSSGGCETARHGGSREDLVAEGPRVNSSREASRRGGACQTDTALLRFSDNTLKRAATPRGDGRSRVTAFIQLMHASSSEAVSYTHLTLPTKALV